MILSRYGRRAPNRDVTSAPRWRSGSAPMSSSSPRGPSAVCAVAAALVCAPNQASATGRPSGTRDEHVGDRRRRTPGVVLDGGRDPVHGVASPAGARGRRSDLGYVARTRPRRCSRVIPAISVTAGAGPSAPRPPHPAAARRRVASRPARPTRNSANTAGRRCASSSRPPSADARSRASASPRPVPLPGRHLALEDPGGQVVGHAGALVGHLDDDRARRPARPGADGRGAGAVLAASSR